MTRTPIVAANWKMHGSTADNADLLMPIAKASETIEGSEIIIFPPAIYLSQVAELLKGSSLQYGAQNVSEHAKGAFTGETAVSMVSDLGASHILVGHSERRALYHESDEQVAEKFASALEAGLTPVLCIGETLEERQAGETLNRVLGQIDAVSEKVGADGLRKGIIAYEPVWAIGTGETATPEQAQEVHAAIRSHLSKLDTELAEGMRILYGGSVKASNAAELFSMTDIDGGLIGGASLKADEFIAICEATGN